MSEKPILFNTDMVRAILDGRKTVTRRAVKPRYVDGDAGFNIVTNSKTGAFCYIEYYDDYERSTDRRMTPPYHTGDILWVRETFRIDYLSNIIGMGRVHYKADGSFADIRFAPNRYDMMRRAQLKPGWRPNENMPREAARIFLRVTDVRVEQLQEMTVNDLQSEGILPAGYLSQYAVMTEADGLFDHFKSIWGSTIKPAGRDRYGWAANPWVWVIKFERCEKPGEG